MANFFWKQIFWRGFQEYEKYVKRETEAEPEWGPAGRERLSEASYDIYKLLFNKYLCIEFELLSTAGTEFYLWKMPLLVSFF